MWKILGRKRDWVYGCTISESIHTETKHRRYSATIDGWENWRLMVVDQASPDVVRQVITKVRAIKARIDSGDEDVFDQADQAW